MVGRKKDATGQKKPAGMKCGQNKDPFKNFASGHPWDQIPCRRGKKKPKIVPEQGMLGDHSSPLGKKV